MNAMFRATSYLEWGLVVGRKRKTREAESQAKEKKSKIDTLVMSNEWI